MRIGMMFVAALSLGIVITALTMQGRQTPGVINAFANGGARLIEASLGQAPSGR